MQLMQILSAESALMRDFIVVLEREQAALSDDDADVIHQIALEKSAFVQQLGQHAAQRNTCLTRAGHSADRAGLEAFIASQPETSGLAKGWDGLRTLVEQANELNRINGTLIRTRMLHNQQALSILTGGNAGVRLYGPDGKSNGSHGAGGRSLGSV